MGLLPVAGRLTWLVYIIGAVIGGRVSFASTDEQDAMELRACLSVSPRTEASRFTALTLPPPFGS